MSLGAQGSPILLSVSFKLKGAVVGANSVKVQSWKSN